MWLIIVFLCVALIFMVGIAICLYFEMWVTREELLESEMVRQSLLDDGVYYARKIKDWELSYEAMKNGNKMCHASILQKDAKIQMLVKEINAVNDKSRVLQCALMEERDLSGRLTTASYEMQKMITNLKKKPKRKPAKKSKKCTPSKR